MSLLDRLFGSRKEKAKEPVEKEFTFTVSEIVCSGDYYKYKVKADNHKEAFRLLVKYFFGKPSYEEREKVESSSGTVSMPQNDRFDYEGMPRWFAKRISGHVRNFDTGEDFQKDLEKFCIDHNIKLDRD